MLNKKFIILLGLALILIISLRIYLNLDNVPEQKLSDSRETISDSRETIRIVGSSTVYPFSTVVAERFGRVTGFQTPIIESTGTGGGFKFFCDGVGSDYPDISNASRRIKNSEYDLCTQNGIAPNDIIEVTIGFDGIVVAHAHAKNDHNISFTRQELFLALAQQVPSDNQNWISNPYNRWSDINSNLSNQEIHVYGPSPTSGTRDAFIELVMEPGCETLSTPLSTLTPQQREQVCAHIREDGAFIEVGENDNLIIQKLINDPNAFGIFGYSFLEENINKVQGTSIENVPPTFQTIESGEYPVARPLFFYVKKPHMALIPGLKEYVTEFLSDKAIGETGYLIQRGLIPLPKTDIETIRQNLNN